MLPPVVALPNSQISYQDQRPSYDLSSGAQLNAPAAHAGMATGLGQSSAVAGRLNILLLSGRERMAQNLAMVAEIFGAAIGVTRKQGESTASFAARLADAIATLPLDQRLKLEGQLVRALNGAQLRILLAAFKDPGGPDAAKLSVLIELARAKDGDLAARSVVTSYRQNAGEIRAEAPVDKGSGKAPPPPPPGGQAGETAIAGPEELPSDAGVAADGETAIGESDLKEQALTGNSSDTDGATHAGKTPGEQKIAEARAEAAKDVEAVAQQQEQEQEADAASSDRLQRGDARTLQAALAREFAPMAATVAAQAAAQAEQASLSAKAASVTEPAEQAEADGDGIDRMRNAFKALIGEVLLESSAQEQSRSREAPQTMLALKGWREVDNLYPNLAVERQDGGNKAIMADPLREAGADDTGQAAAVENKLAGDPGIEERARQAASAVAVEYQVTVGEAATEHRYGRSFPEALLSQWQLIDEQIGSGRLPAQASQVPPLAVANYLFARDEEDTVEARPQEEARRQFSGSDGGGEQQSAAGEDKPDEEANAAEQEQTGEAVEAQEPMTAHLSRAPEADRANDLYWRMAGWS